LKEAVQHEGGTDAAAKLFRPQFLALMQSCRQIRKEFRFLYLEQTEVFLRPLEVSEYVKDFLRKPPPLYYGLKIERDLKARIAIDVTPINVETHDRVQNMRDLGWVIKAMDLAPRARYRFICNQPGNGLTVAASLDLRIIGNHIRRSRHCAEYSTVSLRVQQGKETMLVVQFVAGHIPYDREHPDAIPPELTEFVGFMGFKPEERISVVLVAASWPVEDKGGWLCVTVYKVRTPRVPRALS
jgi:hypothetical protein